MALGRTEANGDAMPDDVALSDSERAELERLRAEVASLRSQAQTADTTPSEAAVPPRPPSRQRWRSAVASLLIVVGCILAPLSVVAVWTRNQVTDTDRYVATVAPLANDPAIQAAITDKITAQIFNYIDVQAITNQAVDALATRGLPPAVADPLHALSVPLAGGVESFTHDQVSKVVASDRFADAWVSANRAAHAALVTALTGEGGGGISIENDTVSINLGPFIQVVKQRLVESGFELASRIPEVNTSFVLFQSNALASARDGIRLLTIIGNWLPGLVLVLFVIGVYVAKGHRRALVGAGLGLAAGMVALALGIYAFRALYLRELPAEVLPHDAAAALYDTVVRFLRLGLRTILVLGLVVALAAFLTGRSPTAVRARTGVTGAIGRLRGGAEKAGLRTGPVGTWIYAYKRPLRIAVIALAALVLVFWDRPTGVVIIVLTLVVLVVLAIIEFLGRPPAMPTAVEVTTSQGAGAVYEPVDSGPGPTGPPA